jgi:hypothetical protein
LANTSKNEKFTIRKSAKRKLPHNNILEEPPMKKNNFFSEDNEEILKSNSELEINTEEMKLELELL